MAMDDDTKKLIEEIREKNIRVGQIAKELGGPQEREITASVGEIAAAIGRLEAEVSR